MYTHHQPEHWNTDRWSEHWSSCYSQMFCWKLLSPGVHVEPLWRVSSIQTWLQIRFTPHGSSTARLQDNSPATLQKQLRSRRCWTGLWVPQIPNQLSICGMHQNQVPSTLEPPWIGLSSWYILWKLSWFEIWGIQIPGRHFELFVTFCGSFLTCHWGVSLSWGGALGLQLCLGDWCLSNRGLC